jgi:hypothetical protein
MIIGLDFDNTIVCYQRALVNLSREIEGLTEDLPRTKIGLRNYLRSQGREDEWTEFQGRLYGPGMEEAAPFEGAVETMKTLQRQGHKLVIVSHRSKYPYRGTQYNLHHYAESWIRKNLHCHGLFRDGEEIKNVDFLEKKDDKLAKIKAHACDFFVDDLPEIIDHQMFPVDTVGILFNSVNAVDNEKSINAKLEIRCWHHLVGLIAEICTRK